ncbi:MAG TPA: MerR family transcriptional regulator [Anaerolineales bacterium]|nr:MerR family transcriptional regulator [Anaerolineales bacterium]
MKDNYIQNYTIRETAKLTGLPESTLRYYETIGLIHPITRDASSKHRVYSEDDVNRIIALACLSAIGMSIENMRAYLKNQMLGEQAADEQVELLETQQKHLAEEARMLELRRLYVDSKIAFWKAVKSGGKEEIEVARKETYAIAQELKLPKVLSKGKVSSSVVS